MMDVSVAMLNDYNRRMAILLDSTKKVMNELEREQKQKTGIEAIQTSLHEQMNGLSSNERKLIAQCWAY